MAEKKIKSLLESGIIILDKPIGPTSHQTTAYLMDILGIEKAGHSGTLDPKVSGVLPIGINKGTKILELLLKFPKEYVGVMDLHKDVSLEKINEVIDEKFLGKIKQLPPRKSAVKRQERIREVYSFKILEKRDNKVLFITKVQAGTYIRKLIHDLGEELNVGAHMLELRRTSVADFTEKQSHTLYEIAKIMQNKDYVELKKIILPIELAVTHLEKINLTNKELQKIKYGQFIKVKGKSKGKKKYKDDYIAGFYKKKLVCLFRKRESMLKPDKVFL